MVADLVKPFIEPKPLQRTGSGTIPRVPIAVSGEKRVLRQNVFDVGKDKLLVLLLVMEAEFDHEQDFRSKICVAGAE